MYRPLALAGLAVMLAAPAFAATETYRATLTAAAEAPPTTSTGKGEATVVLDTVTHVATFDVTYSGFATAPVAAHIHGPAEAGKNAGVLVPLGAASPSPIHGTATLTADQEKALQSGMTYVNIHTAEDKSGAIRGQLTK